MNRLLLCLFLVSCVADPEPPVPSQTLSLKAAGLWLTSNPLEAPPGALANAKNTVIRRPGVAEKRRGNAPDSQFSGNVLSMAPFQGSVIVHTAADTLEQRTAPGVTPNYTGTFEAPEGAPVRFAEAGGALYFTSSAGLYRLDSAASEGPVLAGEPPGLEGSAALTGSTGWLPGGTLASGTVTLTGGAGNVTVVINGTSVGPVAFNATDAQTALDTITAINANVTLQPLVTASSGGSGIILITSDTSGPAYNYTLTASRTAGTATASGATLTGGVAGSTVGYRVLWGRKTENGTLIVGAPSGRMLVTNSTGGTRDVVLTLPIPTGITANVDFLQVYRTVLIAEAGEDPGEDMAQVNEVFPTTAEISAGTFTVPDIAPYPNGETAYFSPSLGPGLADTRERPPLLTDIVSFKGYMVGVVQDYVQSITLSLVAVGGTAGGLENGGGLKFIGDGWTETFKATVNPEGSLIDPGVWGITRTTTGTAAQNIEATARSFVRVINLRSSHLFATYASATSDLPGQILIMSRSADEATIVAQAFVNAAAWNPRLRCVQTCDLTRLANVVTVQMEGNAGLVVGQTINITSTDPDFPSGIKTVASVPSSNTWTYAEAGINDTTLIQIASTTTEEVEFTQEARTSSWAHSSFEEYDGWPPRFRYQLPNTSATLYRITPQGDALLFWTSDGLYRLTGDDENSFTLKPLDTTYILVGQNTPVSVGGRAYAVTTRGGVVVVDETVNVISGPVDQVLNEYYNGTEEPLLITKGVAFGVGNEAEQEYTLFLPDLNGSPDDPAVKAYTYNAKTSTWVGPWEWEWATINPGTKYVRTGMVGPEGRLWLGSEAWLTLERKSRTLADFQDSTGAGIEQEVEHIVQTANNPGLSKQWVEVTALLEAPQPATVDMYFTTEIDGTEEGGTLTSQGNLALRTGIPRNKSRSARLSVILQNDTAEENMSLLGLSVIYNATSPKVGR